LPAAGSAESTGGNGENGVFSFLFSQFPQFALLNLAQIFDPGRINLLMPSVTFISWKLISNPSGTSSSFM